MKTKTEYVIQLLLGGFETHHWYDTKKVYKRKSDAMRGFQRWEVKEHRRSKYPVNGRVVERTEEVLAR